MSRRVPLENRSMSERKQKSAERLIERYLGKKDLLATWDERPHDDREYRNGLKGRVHRHKQDLITRGKFYPQDNNNQIEREEHVIRGSDT